MSHRLDPEANETRVIHDLVSFTAKDVLEIGSGEGRLTWRFADHARSVLALDVKPTRIAVALDDLPDRLRSKVTFRLADVITADLPVAGFDVAVLSWSL